MSPISSRKSVPPSASSKRPRLVLTAPVKAPRTWPKSSLSIRPSGSAVQLIGTKGLLRSARRKVQGAGDQLLARPALAGDQDVDPATRHLAHQREDLSHRPGCPISSPKELVRSTARRRRRFSSSRLPCSKARCRRTSNRVALEGLGDVVERPGLHGLHRRIDAAKGGHQDHRRLRADLTNLTQKLHSGPTRHANVRDDGVVLPLSEPLDGLVGAAGGLRDVPLVLEERDHHLSHGLIIVHNQNRTFVGMHDVLEEQVACQAVHALGALSADLP